MPLNSVILIELGVMILLLENHQSVGSPPAFEDLSQSVERLQAQVRADQERIEINQRAEELSKHEEALEALKREVRQAEIRKETVMREIAQEINPMKTEAKEGW